MIKTAIVTGASGGIGKAITERLVNAGYRVVAQYKNNPQELQGLGAEAVYGDFSCRDGAEDFARRVLKTAGRIDVLVNNAGVALSKLFTDCSAEELQEIIFTDLTSVMLVSRAVIPIMVSQKSGSIVNVGSVWGVYGGSCEVAYSAAKGGICGFTKALSRELGLSNIRVNCVCPGLIETKMNAELTEEDKRGFLEGVSLGRAGSAAEVASCVEFLCSDASSYVTGQILGVDGGF